MSGTVHSIASSIHRIRLRPRPGLRAAFALQAAAAAFLAIASPASAITPYALGYQWESWSDVRYKKGAGENTFTHPAIDERVSFTGLRGWTLEEPGLIFGAVSAVYGTEAEIIEARNKAIRNRERLFRWKYATPPEIPSYRWWRWSYMSSDGTVDSDSTKAIRMSRLDAHIVMAPRLIGDLGAYWMLSAPISFTFMDYGDKCGQNLCNADKPGPMATPMVFHLGYQPPVFPWLMLEGFGGWDFLQWGLAALVHTEGYTQGWLYGGKASLGTNWLSFYYQYHESNQPTYSSKKEGGWGFFRGSHSVAGVRVDLGELLGSFF